MHHEGTAFDVQDVTRAVEVQMGLVDGTTVPTLLPSARAGRGPGPHQGFKAAAPHAAPAQSSSVRILYALGDGRAVAMLYHPRYIHRVSPACVLLCNSRN